MKENDEGKTYSLYLSGAVVAQLDDLAAKSKRSRSQVVELLLVEALNRKPQRV